MTEVAAGSASDPAGGLEERLAELMRDFPPIVCFANDWRGDPTSKHHIMRLLGKHVPVLWVESSGMRRPNLASAADLRRIAGRLRRQAVAPVAPAAAAEPGVRVISPLCLPLPGNPIAERVNAWLYRQAVRGAQPAGRPPLLWVYQPTVAPYLDGIPRSGLVYHCVDRWWAFSEFDSKAMRRYHAELCRKADVVFASAAELQEDCRQYNPDAVLMPHGVDWDHFSRAAFAPPPRPADIADITGPIIGFFGLLHDWIDQELLLRVSEELPEATMVLIGKARVDISRLVARPNIRWLGQKPYAELPAYAAAFDVALVPFVRNHLTAAVNPIKLLEYLSAGVPVVATALPEIVRMGERPGLAVTGDQCEFLTVVGERVQRRKTGPERHAISIAQRNDSWIGRCVRMVENVTS